MSVEELCLATVRGDLELVKEILTGGKIDVNEKDKYGTTALIRAREKGRNEVVKYLLANGANATKKNK
jgi:ankyrin repeat protein